MSAPAAALEGLSVEALLDTGAASRIELRGTVASAVLVALYELDGALHTVLTARRRDLSRHGGEISFPGGRSDPADPDLVWTALRETYEEIGLPPDAVRVLGALQPTPTIATGYAIYPFVGLISAGRRWEASEAEVAEVIDVPLSDLVAGYARRRIVRRGLTVWTDTYITGDHLVWGATARILADLLWRINPTASGVAASASG